MENASDDFQGQRVLATIMFTDVVDYSSQMGEDEENTLLRVRRDLAFITDVCSQHRGKVLKNTGDGLLIFFTAAGDAVQAALKIQEHFTRPADHPATNDHLSHRIGIHLGDVFLTGDDVVGDGVNVAARLLTKAEPGGISISQTVYDVVKNRLTLKTTYLGPQELKHIREAVPIYQIITSALQKPAADTSVQPPVAAVPVSSPTPVRPPAPQSPSRRPKTAAIAVIALGLIVGIALSIRSWKAKPREAVSAPAASAPVVSTAAIATSTSNETDWTTAALSHVPLIPNSALPADWAVYAIQDRDPKPGKLAISWDNTENPPALCLASDGGPVSQTLDIPFMRLGESGFNIHFELKAQPAFNLSLILHSTEQGNLVAWDNIFDTGYGNIDPGWRAFDIRKAFRPRTTEAVLHVRCFGEGKAWIRNFSIKPIPSNVAATTPKTSAGQPTPSAVQSRSIDLMPLLPNPLPSPWQVDNGHPVSGIADENAGRIILKRVSLPDEYDFTVDFVGESPDGELLQILAHDGSTFYWTTGVQGGLVPGFGDVNGAMPDANPTGVWTRTSYGMGRHTSEVHVRKDSIAGFIDGKLICEYQTNFRELGLVHGEWNNFMPNTIGISTWKSQIRILAMRLTEISGHVEIKPE